MEGALPLVGWAGGLGLVLGPFGGYAFNLSAITAAICMGNDEHPDSGRSYPAGYWCGVFYVLAGIFGGAVAISFAAFPRELVATSLKSALEDESKREAAMITLAVTASGMTLFSIGSAFWGLVFGLVVHVVMPTKGG